jgi:hypothetical protein
MPGMNAHHGNSPRLVAAFQAALLHPAAQASPSAYPRGQLGSVAGAWTAAQAMCVTSPQEFSG